MQHKKRYSPQLIRNPSSENHVVRVHPEQEFVVSLTNDVGEIEVVTKSEYLTLTGTKSKGDRKQFYFGQKFNMADWSTVSRMHLGEVVLICENRKEPVTLSVVLESPNNPTMLTLVNPTGATAKIGPDMVVEVALFDAALGREDIWDFRIVPGERRLKVQKGWDEIIHPEFTGNDDFFAINTKDEAIRRSSNNLLENHYWFKFDDYSKKTIATLSPGTYNAGRIVFEVRGADGMFRRDLLLQLHLKQKYNKFSPAEYCKKNNISVVNQSSYHDRHSGIVTTSYNSHRTYVPPATAIVKKEPELPQRAVVQIKEKDKVTLDSGCFWIYHNEYKSKLQDQKDKLEYLHYGGYD